MIRACFLAAALTFALPGCVIHTVGPGAVAADGSVYLGFSLVDAKGKPDREQYDVGHHLGAFSSIRLIADEGVEVTKIRVVLADGERYDAAPPGRFSGSSQPIVLPRGPRAIHSVVVAGRSLKKGLAKIEIFGTR